MSTLEARPQFDTQPEAIPESDQAVEILLVEDNPNDVQLTLHALKRQRLTNHIHVVRDGAEALEFLFATGAYAHRKIADSPKVVMLDLKLPRVDGMEVLRELRADPRTKTIPVVVLTSSREERDITQTYGLGANSYIVKPVDFEQFTEAVRQLGLYWVLLNQQAPAQDLATSAVASAGGENET
jgi:two-component system response regulator